MEKKANYALIGLFTLAVIASAFGFVLWFENLGTKKTRIGYRIIFEGPVVGLRTGANVNFNGMRIGEVDSVRIDDPQHVVALVSVERKAPVRKDTTVGLEFQGLTGIASVSLKGALVSSPPLKGKNGEMPTLRADTGASQDLSASVRESLNKVDAVIAENQESLHNTMKNLESFSEALARNGEKIDKLLASTTETMDSVHTLSDNLDKRTAVITNDVHKVADTANKQIEKVGNQATKSIDNIDKAVTDLAKHPQRFLFGGGDSR